MSLYTRVCLAQLLCLYCSIVYLLTMLPLAVQCWLCFQNISFSPKIPSDHLLVYVDADLLGSIVIPVYIFFFTTRKSPLLHIDISLHGKSLALSTHLISLKPCKLLCECVGPTHSWYTHTGDFHYHGSFDLFSVWAFIYITE